MNKPVKVILGIGIVVILYAFAARAAGIYFFWESSFLGWTVLAIGGLVWLFRAIKVKKVAGKKKLWEKLGVAFLLFLLTIQLIVVIVIPRTGAYAAATSYIVKNDSLKRELGDIEGFGFTESGSIAESSKETGEAAGNAELNLIVKGKKKYKDITVDMLKDWNTPWAVQAIQ